MFNPGLWKAGSGQDPTTSFLQPTPLLQDGTEIHGALQEQSLWWGQGLVIGYVNFPFQSKQKTDPNAAKVPQPDNAEQELAIDKGEEEACLAVGRDKYERGTFWNDVSCYNEMEWVCEDSTELLTKAGLNQPIVFGKWKRKNRPFVCSDEQMTLRW